MSNYIELAKVLIRKHEGKRNTLYDDATGAEVKGYIGHPTIGYGFNLDLPVPDEVLDFWLDWVLRNDTEPKDWDNA